MADTSGSETLVHDSIQDPAKQYKFDVKVAAIENQKIFTALKSYPILSSTDDLLRLLWCCHSRP
jgi:hypothetical protein